MSKGEKIHSPTKAIRKRIKLIAAFFTINFLSSLFAPNVAYALTSGPVAPEYTSFEPVDTSDVVNLQTGDFTYNVPLMEVPGPAGGFPLSLSYHAGIQPDQDASWVGLGWTLNPGSIYRYVNGYPDEHKNVDQTVRDFWSGGSATYTSYGVSFGIGKFASVSANVIVASDSYKGSGTGYGFGASYGLPIGDHGSVGLNASATKLPFGGWDKSIGISAGLHGGVGGLNGSLSTGINRNFGASGGSTTGGVSAGVSAAVKNGVDKKNEPRYKSISMVGASISTNFKNGGSSVGVSIAGANSSQNNSTAGKISQRQSSSGFTIPTPVPGLSFSKKRTYIRYWSDESENVGTYGSLFNVIPSSTQTSLNQYNNRSYDIYDISDYDEKPKNESKRELNNEGTFLNYDVYNVHAQGLSGNMRPYYYKAYANRRNIKHLDSDNNTVYDEINYQLNSSSQTKPEFRFVDDFGNKITQNAHYTNSTNSTPIDIDLDGSITTFDHDMIGNIISLPGSKNIEYHLNEGQDLLTGFTITNESGVKYEFKQPVYAYGEHIYNENIDKRKKLDSGGNPDGGYSFNHLKKPAKYAYTWLLTAMKGPDYVDRGSSGLSDDDWGYWVEFDYGMWTSSYGWRTPDTGFNQDLDNNFQGFSSGYKELYYLDAIRTATHTALFEKSIRKDGHGVAFEKFVAKTVNDNNDVLVDEGGYTPKEEAEQVGEIDYAPCGINVQVPFYAYRYPKATLKLDNIRLFKNEDLDPLNINKNRSNYYSQVYVSPDNGCTTETLTQNIHFGSNVWDEDDAKDYPELKDLSIRSVKLISDYSLSNNTTNSFGNANLYRANNPLIGNGSGKLTLKKLQFQGKGEASMIPPTHFEYDLNDVFQTMDSYVTVDESSGYILGSFASDKYKIGEIIESEMEIETCISYPGIPGCEGSTVTSSKLFYVTEITSNALAVSPLGGTFSLANTSTFNYTLHSIKIKRTKNPYYLKDYTDIWGYFKSDYVNTEQNNLDRITTQVSGGAADVWSLRGIKSSLGTEISIDYESDTYKKPVFGKSYPIILKDPSFNSQGRLRGTLDSQVSGLFSTSSKVDLKIVYFINRQLGNVDSGPGSTIKNVSEVYIPSVAYDVVSKSGNQITTKFLEVYLPQGAVVKQVNIGYPHGDFKYGGGIRVASINTSDPVTETTESTIYQYNEVDTGGNLIVPSSSGITSYEPIIMDPAYKDLTDEERTKVAQASIGETFKEILEFSRFIPGPSVYYGNVTMTGAVEKQGIVAEKPGKSVYEFQTFDLNMIALNKTSSPTHISSGNYLGKEFVSRKVDKTHLINAASGIGNLKSVSFYDKDGDILTKSENHYLLDLLLQENITNYDNALRDKFEHQGVVQESYASGRLVRNETDDKYDALGVLANIYSYPNILLGERHYNYRTGIETKNYNIAFDQLSGQLTESITSDGYGNHYLNKSTPAFRVSAYSDMKDDNLLAQEAGNELWMIDEPTLDGFLLDHNEPIIKKGLVSASSTTWKKFGNAVDGVTTQTQGQNGIWRQSGQYAWIGDESEDKNKDGTDKPINYQTFNYSNESSNGSKWQRNSLITKYDVNSHALEVKDVNNNFAATKFDNKNERVFATVANARYDEFAYSGAEDDLVNINNTDYFGGGVIKIGGQVRTKSETDLVHTGQKSLRSSNTGSPFNYYLTAPEAAGRTFRASVWTTHQSAQLRIKIDGGSALIGTTSDAKKAGAWYLINLDFYVPNEYQEVDIHTRGVSSTNVFWDDFRVHPIDATMTSYAYNEWGELSHILDANNLFTYYDYDAMGRLKSVTRETFTDGPVKVSEVDIYYSEGRTDEAMYGTIKNSSNNNLMSLSVDFSAPGTDNITYEWDINGSKYTRTKNSLSYTITSGNEGWKDVIVTVTDDITGVSFTDHKRIHFNYCTPPNPTTPASFYCERINGCLTGFVVEMYHNGNCGYDIVKRYDPNACDRNDCNGECPPNEICEVEQQ